MRGRSHTTLELMAACRKIVEQLQPHTVRGVAYQLFVGAIAGKWIQSMERKYTALVSRTLKKMREDGDGPDADPRYTIPWPWIVDESRDWDRAQTWGDLRQYGETIARAYRRDFWAHQKVRVVVISEKATVAGLLWPVLDEYGVPFFAAHGFNSATKMHEFAEDIIYAASAVGYDALSKLAQHTIILYVGDYDPSGMWMSEMDLRQRLNRYGAEGKYTIIRIALARDDLRGLPSFKAEEKKDDPRYKWFVKNYGRTCWEIDAMNPNDLRDRVKEWVERYIKKADWQRHKRIEKAERETTARLAKRMGGANVA